MSDDESTGVEGISIGGYRSFGTVQRIAPLSKVNIFIGANNSGKSNVLRFIHEHLGSLIGDVRDTKPWEKLRREIDGHIGTGQQPLTAGIGSKFNSSRLQAIREGTRNQKVIDLFEELLRQQELSFGTSMLWHECVSYDFGRTRKVMSGDEGTLKNLLKRYKDRHSQIHDLWRLIKPGWSGGSLEGWFNDIIGFLLTNNRQLPPAILIPAGREITAEKTDSKSWCGAGIVDHLAQLQNPDHHEQEKKRLFRAVESLLQDVTGNERASLEIPYGRNSITVHMDNKSLPLESLGTGIHELVILAAACTSLEKRTVCIEEPEIHLNPILQRKLLGYLCEKTDNQYFITSHSAALIDTELASIYQVSHDGVQTSVTLTSKAGERWQICRELGYKASDLMQSNCIIWVEGPSDRIYLNHWIKSLDSSVKEQTHYSIMFYGGRLLCHLSADDEEVGEFISLSHLNRNPAIVIDSDKKNGDDSINATKQRIIREFEKCNALCWVTVGREIENYISEEQYRDSLNALSEGSSRGRKYDQYEKLVPQNVDKIDLAHEVVSRSVDLNVLDLRDRMTQLVEYIRTANE